MKDLFPLIVIQLLRYFGCFPGMFLKKSQSLAFQVLSYSVRFHCCYILLCGSSNPTNHLHVAQVAPVILLFPFMGLLRYLKMIGFVYSVEFEQPGSGDKNCCICLKIAWGIYVHFFLSKVHPLITSVEYWEKWLVLSGLFNFVLLVVLFWFVGWFFFCTFFGTSCLMVILLPCLKARESWLLNAYTSEHSGVTWIVSLNKWQY